MLITRNDIQRISNTDLSLLEKLNNTGTPLGQHWEIHYGINTGCSEAFVIDEFKHQELIRRDPRSAEIIKLKVGKYQKNRWKPVLKYLIWIPSSEFMQWPWSDAGSESTAMQIFEETYPAISDHLSNYDGVKKRHANFKGKFYWELSTCGQYPEFQVFKIFFYNKPPIIACYDPSGAVVVNTKVYSISTADFSLLAILNSKLFEWYVQTMRKKEGRWNINKTNMKNFRVPDGTGAQKAEISNIVQQILEAPDDHKVPDIEREIDQLVYKLYELTDAETALIEEETNL